LNKENLEKYSSAVTMSDMEIFVFPELMYALVLANIMSPIIWEWRKDPWFDKIDKMAEYRKVLRIKQFIMNKFVFNLDLDTWGLTTKEKELSRFSDFVDLSILAESNALFGYEGDKYYFDIDIRKHFGLDKYTSNVIPYWKTETVEAMEAFKNKKNYPSGAGECVSLATLYAATLFVIGKIELKKIYLFATPLHSQNFIDIREGILTNNRRIVTKNMLFNGTELSSKARRALENENITLIANNTGYIHTLFDEATISKESYYKFFDRLKDFLKTEITFKVLASFLRAKSDLQICFQYRFDKFNSPRYVPSEVIFHYEHSSKYIFGSDTTQKLLEEIDEYDLYQSPVSNRLILNDIEKILTDKEMPVDSPATIEILKNELKNSCFMTNKIIRELIDFCRIEPKFSNKGKTFIREEPIEIGAEQSREDIIIYLESIRTGNRVADLSFYAFRDMNRISWRPFIKAAIERNPVILEAVRELELKECLEVLKGMPEESIYSGTRLAQPDEVWNYSRGDGLEKAIAFFTILKNRDPDCRIELNWRDSSVILTENDREWSFDSKKSKYISQPDQQIFTNC
jgi:hypothetical protein